MTLPSDMPATAPKILPAKSTDFLRTKPRAPQSERGLVRDWLVVPGVGYHLKVTDLGIQFDCTRVRNRYDETYGLLTVRADFRGAKVISDHIISSADFNLSSMKSRQERARHLHERACADSIDWLGLLEDLCLRVLHHEERGQPEIPLEDVPSDIDVSAEIEAGTLPLLRSHPTIWFGDGAAGKSMLALFAGIDLAQSGYRVLYCDWELDGESHSQRLKRFVGPVPGLRDSLIYRRCERSFQREALQIRDIIAKRKISFLICDSIGFAAEGAPESAEAATGYFRAMRECGPIGSLHLAHMNRSDQGDQKPFGSIFWHAGARSTWFLKRTAPDDSSDMMVAFYNRKSNLGKLRPAFGRRLSFLPSETRISVCDVADDDALARELPLWQRIESALRNGPMTTGSLASDLEVKEDTVRKTAERRNKTFLKIVGSDGVQRISLIHK
jgi:hypothetical protein